MGLLFSYVYKINYIISSAIKLCYYVTTIHMGLLILNMILSQIIIKNLLFNTEFPNHVKTFRRLETINKKYFKDPIYTLVIFVVKKGNKRGKNP